MRFPQLILAFSITVLALYQDQAGVLDWHRELIGKVDRALFMPGDSASQSVLMVVSDRALIAALSPRSGEIIWRRELMAGDKVSAILEFGSNVGVLSRSVLNIYDINNGSLWWSYAVDSADARVVALDGDAVVTISNRVCRISRGESAWCSDLGSKCSTAVSFALGSENILSVCETQAWLLSRDEGNIVTSFPLDGYTIPGTTARVLGNYLFWLDGAYLYYVSIEQKSVSYASLSAMTAYPTGFEVLFENDGHFIVSVSAKNGAWVGRLDSKSSIITKLLDAGSESRVSSATMAEGKAYMASSQGKRVSMSSYDFSTNSVERESILLSDDVVLVEAFGSDSGAGAFTLCADGSIRMIKDDMSTVWIRDEGISDILAQNFVELPGEVLLADHYVAQSEDSIAMAYLNRWSYQLKDIGKSLPVVGIQPAQNLTRDKSGFVNLLVLVSRNGDISGFRTDNGLLVWSKRMFEYVHDARIWLQTYRHVTESVTPLLSLTVSRAGETTVWIINALSGEVVQTKKFNMDTVAAIKTSGRIVLLSANLNAASIDSITQGEQLSIRLSEKDLLGCVIRGKECVRTWSFRAPSAWKMLKVSRNSNERIASVGRILGDRSVLYKYLNPNAIVVLMAKKSHMAVVCLDSVSGRILYSQYHDNFLGADDVSIEMHENALFYVFRSLQPRVRDGSQFDIMTQLSVVEFYESVTPDARIKYDSPFLSVSPGVLSQSYLLDHRVISLGVTKTRNGIAANDIVVATSSGQLLAFPRRLVDPRRPYKTASKMSAEEKEEGLIPYQPVLEDNPKTTLSYNLDVRGVQQIVFMPTGLESTTIAFAFGLDHFMTRVSPSQMFDTLGEDFSRSTLVLVMVGLCGGIFVSKELVRRQNLKQAWQMWQYIYRSFLAMSALCLLALTLYRSAFDQGTLVSTITIQVSRHHPPKLSNQSPNTNDQIPASLEPVEKTPQRPAPKLNCGERHLSCYQAQLPRCKFQVPINYNQGTWIKVRNESDLDKIAYSYQNRCNSGKFHCHIKEPNTCRQKAQQIMNWEWIPSGCRSVLYVGDSLMRQMFNSIRMLTLNRWREHEKGSEVLISDSGSTFRFAWSKYLIDEIAYETNKSVRVKSTWAGVIKAYQVDVLVLNVGHHWHKIDPHFNSYLDMVKHVTRFLDEYFTGNLIIFRTSTPGHYNCAQKEFQTPIDYVPILNAKNDRWSWRKPVVAELAWKQAFTGTRLESKFRYLNVSHSIYRADAHPEFKMRNNMTTEDCLHWCLPGIPDTWNHMLFNMLTDE